MSIESLLEGYKNPLITSPNGKQYLNDGNYPEEIVALLISTSEQGYSGSTDYEFGKISTTQLIKAPRIYLHKLLFKEIPVITSLSHIYASSIGTIIHSKIKEAISYMKHKGIKTDIRKERAYKNWLISGEYDICSKGMVKDLKVVGSYTYTLLQKEMKLQLNTVSIMAQLEKAPVVTGYRLQLSIYKWIHEDITEDKGSIIFMFKDSRDVPSNSVEVSFELFNETELLNFFDFRIEQFESWKITGTLPRCSDIQRNLSLGEFKLKRLGKTGKWATVRGSKFTNVIAFNNFCSTNKRHTDEVVEIPSSYRWCNSCEYRSKCAQNLEKINDY